MKKIFNPVITQELKEEFKNEILSLAEIRHPGIVLIMGIVCKPPNLCLVTEYLPNGTLSDYLHKSK